MFAATRAAAKAALDTVEGVTGYVDPPTSPRVGDAWAVWAGGERGPGFSWLHSWRILLVLTGADAPTAMAEAEGLLYPIAVALADVLHVTDVVPVDLPTQVGPLLALEFRGVCE